jgi:hypothetical protein
MRNSHMTITIVNTTIKHHSISLRARDEKRRGRVRNITYSGTLGLREIELCFMVVLTMVMVM